IPGGVGLIGQRNRLPGVGVELLHLVELAVQLHLELPLVPDHRGGLLGQGLVLALRFFDSLLNLDLRIRVLLDLGVEEGHQIFPGLRERISHRLIPPPSTVPPGRLASARPSRTHRYLSSTMRRPVPATERPRHAAGGPRTPPTNLSAPVRYAH